MYYTYIYKLYNYIRANNFRAFSVHKIFLQQKSELRYLTLFMRVFHRASETSPTPPLASPSRERRGRGDSCSIVSTPNNTIALVMRTGQVRRAQQFAAMSSWSLLLESSATPREKSMDVSHISIYYVQVTSPYIMFSSPLTKTLILSVKRTHPRVV